MTREEFLKIPGVKERLEKLATKHGFTVDQILTVIQKESNFKTTAENPTSKATGLIQFMPATAKGLGTTIEKIKEMDALAQLEIVDKYFDQQYDYFPELKGEHPYLAVAYPKAGKMGMDDVIATPNDSIAKENPPWRNEDGNVTKRSILEYVGAEDRDSKSDQEETEVKPEIKISHTIQLGVQIGDRGGITNEEENKLEELGFTLTKRADDKGVIFFEIETENLDKAKEVIKTLKDNKFENPFIRHTKTNLDGSTVRISDKELYNETGEISNGFSPKKFEAKSGNTSELYKDNIYVIDKAKKNNYGTYTKPRGWAEESEYHTIWDSNAQKNYYLKKSNYAKLSEDDENIKGGEQIFPGIYKGEVNLERKEDLEKEEGDYKIGDTIVNDTYKPFKGPDGNLVTGDLTITGTTVENGVTVLQVQDSNGKVFNTSPNDILLDGTTPLPFTLSEDVPGFATKTEETEETVEPEERTDIQIGNIDPATGLVWNGTEYVKPEGISETSTWSGTEWIEEPSDQSGGEPPLTNFQKAGRLGDVLLKGAGSLLDSIGGPGAIISYVMGKKGLKAAMKEIKPQARPQLSPMFMQHLRQTRELAKKGFHPDEAKAIRKGIGQSYAKGLENAVRGSGGQRAKFLAQSGVLDAQRSAALLNYATKDEELQRKNAEAYEKMMLFKENFDINKSELERTEDIERQQKDKEAAAGFTSAAFTSLMNSYNSSKNGLYMQQMANTYKDGEGMSQFFNHIQNWGKKTEEK